MSGIINEDRKEWNRKVVGFKLYGAWCTYALRWPFVPQVLY